MTTVSFIGIALCAIAKLFGLLTLFVSGGLKTASPILYQVEGAALKENRVVAAESGEGIKTIVGCGRTWLDEKIAVRFNRNLGLSHDRISLTTFK
ncbi:hypothetical protein [Nostoc sp. NMS4]|uniref:hypothetical protein n=1 Tax=Nostoc sp. NMS4 TaxID=2815390 RepID=UPI0025D77281|nr:hypothetical protein [Nostoc sp. NMS4]MBN3922996.1 hypothetical protein [Nostoc sp. NMS4]